MNGFAGLRELKALVLQDKLARAPIPKFTLYLPKKIVLLDIWLNIKGDGGVNGDDLLLTVNDDTTSGNYTNTFHRTTAGGTHSAGTPGATRNISIFATTTSSADQGGSCHIQIFDPCNPFFNKEIRSFVSLRYSTDAESWQYTIVWKNKSPITKLIFSPTTLPGNFINGSRFLAIGYVIR